MGLLVSAALIAGALVACGGAEYRYVNNGSEGAYFKVPKEWGLFRLTQADREGRPESLPGETERVWHVAFDSDPQPDPAHLEDPIPRALVGEAQIWALDSGDSQQISQSRLREILFFGVDPLLQDPGTPPRWEVVSVMPITGEGGAVGTRLVVNVPTDEQNSNWVTLDGSMLLDLTRGRAHLLMMRCESQCYVQNRQKADEIASSWKVRP